MFNFDPMTIRQTTFGQKKSEVREIASVGLRVSSLLLESVKVLCSHKPYWLIVVCHIYSYSIVIASF